MGNAAAEGGRTLAFITVVAMLTGVSMMDSGMVMLGAGAQRVSDRFMRVLGNVLAGALGALGVWLIARGLF